MKFISLVIGVVILAIGGSWLLRDSNSTKPLDDASSKPAIAESVARKRSTQETTERLQVSSPPLIDPDRLYDKAYENDPGLQAAAKAQGIPAECLIALAKYRLHQVPVGSGVCPHPRDAVDFPTLAVGEDHPYNEYSNSQLRSLATSSPEAAVILARRLESDVEARGMYERAVALSGIAAPLIEWMTDRSTGGLFYRNGELDVKAAKEGYKIFLTAAAFGGTTDSTIKLYQEQLRNEGVNLNAIEREAQEEIAEINKLRRELTGGNRHENDNYSGDRAALLRGFMGKLS